METRLRQHRSIPDVIRLCSGEQLLAIIWREELANSVRCLRIGLNKQLWREASRRADEVRLLTPALTPLVTPTRTNVSERVRTISPPEGAIQQVLSTGRDTGERQADNLKSGAHAGGHDANADANLGDDRRTLANAMVPQSA